MWVAHVLRRAIASKNWPTTKGRVLSSEIVEPPYGAEAEVWMTYRAKIEYKYSVGGKTYLSDKICFADYRDIGGARAQRIFQKYAAREYVVVHYDPDNPHIAVLEPGLESGNLPLLVIGLGVGLLLVGLGLLLVLGILG